MVALSLFGFQCIALFGTLLLGCVAYIPIIIKSATAASPTREVVFAYINCFVAGVFLSVGIVDMLHDSVEKFEKNVSSDYPYPFLLAGIGFLLIFFLEQVVLVKIKKAMRDKNVEFEVNHCGDEKTVASCGDMIDVDNAESMGLSESHEESGEHGHFFFFALAVMVVMCMHGLIEGLALGFESNVESGLPVLVAVLVHKGFEGLAIGISVSKVRSSAVKQALICAIFVIMSPLGVGIGMIFQHTSDNVEIACGILMGLGSGSFIYISTMVFKENFGTQQWSRMFAAVLGFTVIAVCLIWAS
eukprot:Nk52_evm46s343 gene=Nk52_evmTU46s343